MKIERVDSPIILTRPIGAVKETELFYFADDSHEYTCLVLEPDNLRSLSRYINLEKGGEFEAHPARQIVILNGELKVWRSK